MAAKKNPTNIVSETDNATRDALNAHLRRFTIEGLANGVQRLALKRAWFIDFKHSMWGLTVLGQNEAIRLGYLD